MQISKVELNLSSNETIDLPPFIGSTIRGAFGNILKETICVQKNIQCQNCMLKNYCIYTYLFESHWYFSNEDKPQAGVSQPFVFDTSNNAKMENHIKLSLMLYGGGINYLPYFIYCFNKIGERGLGTNRIKFKLESVKDAFNKQVPLNDDDESSIIKKRPLTKEWNDYANEAEKIGKIKYCQIHLVTPLRLKQHGKLQDQLNFELFFRAIVRRWQQLCKYYGDEYNYPEINILINNAKSIESGTLNLKWQERERYSRRQDQRILLGGITGTMECEGDLKPFLPWLLLGQDLHIGKNTSFGLGKYLIEFQI